MKIPLPWIQSYLSRPVSDRKIVDALAQAGIEIEGFEPSRDIDRRVAVGLVKKVAQHPNADKLRLARVAVNEQTFDVVCGAPNLAEGQKVAFAMIGSILPGGEEIRQAKLRGEVSQGMICSARELGLGEDHSGIIVLPGDAKVGSPVAELFPAVSVVDVKTPFNRFDVLSVVGLARETAAFAGVSLKVKEPSLAEQAGDSLELQADEQAAPRFMVAELELGNPKDLPERHWLEATGTRLISPIVDVTNFVLWEWGQPLHAYDADKVKGKLGVRYAKAGEKLVTLDGVERKLTKDDLVVTDDAGPVGLAGVMGGERTEVTAGTKRILLEAAVFDAATIRKTAKRYGLRSEASARFERGLPVQLAPIGLARAVQLLEQHSGAKLTGLADELRVWPWTQRTGLRHSRLEHFVGTKIDFDEALKSLNKLGIQATHFNLAEEAKKHIGKPYVWGASFKKNGTDGFDCSYFVDYLYSLIGQPVGHTALAQFEIGRSILGEEIKVGDVLFYEGQDSGGQRDFELEDVQNGNQARSIVGYYFRYDPLTGRHVKVAAKTKKLVGHNGVYIGGGKVIDARKYIRDDSGSWQELPKDKQGVQEVPVEYYLNDPGYLGARRFVEDIGDWISVPAVPWWRPDLKTEEDLIEEIVRVIGYGRVPSTLPAWRPSGLEFDRTTPKLWRLKDLLVGLGLFEVMTYSFISQEQIERHGDDPRHHLKLANPLSQEQAYLRRSPLPSLLAVAARNDRYARQFGMFEITRVFQPGSDHAELPREPHRLAVLVKSQDEAYTAIKGVLDALGRYGGSLLRIKPENLPEFLPGRAAELLNGKQRVGLIGQLHPDLAERSGASGQLGYLEIDLGAALPAEVRQARSVPKFPPVLRDINLRLAVKTTWVEVREVIAVTGLAEPEFVNDFYPGGGHKNLAVRLEMTAPDKTLTDQEAEQRVREVLSALRKKLGAELA